MYEFVIGYHVGGTHCPYRPEDTGRDRDGGLWRHCEQGAQ